MTRKTKRDVQSKKDATNNYIDKKELYNLVVESKEAGEMSNELARMFLLLIERTIRMPKFAGNTTYINLEDMKSYAMMSLMTSWYKFDTNKKNPFAFYTTCITNSFWYFLNKEKRQISIREELTVKEGLNPSHSYMVEYEERQKQEKLEQSQYDYNTDDELPEERLYE